MTEEQRQEMERKLRETNEQSSSGTNYGKKG